MQLENFDHIPTKYRSAYRYAAKLKALKNKPESELTPEEKIIVDNNRQMLRRSAEKRKQRLQDPTYVSRQCNRLSKEVIVLTKEEQAAKDAPKRTKNGNYMSNKELYNEVIKCKAEGRCSDKLATMFMMLVKKYSTKSNWYGYTFNDDMQSEALLTLCKVWDKFNPAKTTNAFAFFTQCIKNCFIQIINKEKDQRDLRDKLRALEGLDTSDSYQLQAREDLQKEFERVDPDKMLS